MTHHSCDVAIIGAGTAGLAAERTAREHGARTLLIDPEFAGTVCATVGCMPSKLLIAAADAAHNVRRAAQFGISVSQPPRVDGPAVMQRVRRLRDEFVAHAKAQIAAIPEPVKLRALARFTGANDLALDNGDTVSARRIVIATGSYPAIPQSYADLGDRVVTNRTVFELPDLPGSLAIIGAGPIGLELAQAMGRLGVVTSLFDTSQGFGQVRCDHAQRELETALRNDLTLQLGVDVEPQRSSDGVKLCWDGAQAGERVFDYVFLATGRPPSLSGLDLACSGLRCDDDGVPEHDRHTMRCGSSTTFICGDADQDRPILHEASAEGKIAGRNAALYPECESVGRHVPFAMIFTDPCYVRIGERPGNASIGRVDFSDQGRAKVEGRSYGKASLYASRDSGRLLGADLCAPGAEHYGHLLAFAIERGLTVGEMLALPFYHPTLEEGLKTALRDTGLASIGAG